VHDRDVIRGRREARQPEFERGRLICTVRGRLPLDSGGDLTNCPPSCAMDRPSGILVYFQKVKP
jgi:hypothetical protein